MVPELITYRDKNKKMDITEQISKIIKNSEAF